MFRCFKFSLETVHSIQIKIFIPIVHKTWTVYSCRRTKSIRVIFNVFKMESSTCRKVEKSDSGAIRIEG